MHWFPITVVGVPILLMILLCWQTGVFNKLRGAKGEEKEKSISPLSLESSPEKPKAKKPDAGKIEQKKKKKGSASQ